MSDYLEQFERDSVEINQAGARNHVVLADAKADVPSKPNRKAESEASICFDVDELVAIDSCLITPESAAQIEPPANTDEL